MAATDSPSGIKVQDAQAGRSNGRLFILSAPSGAGKTTLSDALRRHFDDLAYSISHTTRQPREGERNGHDYFYIGVEEFEEGIAENRWAEWAKVHENYYGSSAQWIEETLSAGGHILMDIDLQGARQMLKRFPNAVTIFIMPPSMEVLESRLRARGTDSPETIELRLANACDEIAGRSICQHTVVNDNLEAAIKQLIELIESYLKA